MTAVQKDVAALAARLDQAALSATAVPPHAVGLDPELVGAAPRPCRSLPARTSGPSSRAWGRRR